MAASTPCASAPERPRAPCSEWTAGPSTGAAAAAAAAAAFCSRGREERALAWIRRHLEPGRQGAAAVWAWGGLPAHTHTLCPCIAGWRAPGRLQGRPCPGLVLSITTGTQAARTGAPGAAASHRKRSRVCWPPLASHARSRCPSLSPARYRWCAEQPPGGRPAGRAKTWPAFLGVLEQRGWTAPGLLRRLDGGGGCEERAN